MNTEVMLKQKEVAISDIADVVLGGTPKTDVEEYWSGDIKWASAKDVVNCKGRYIEETEKTISKKGIDNSAAKILSKGTIVITSRGTVGATCMLPESMSFNQTCYGLVAKNGTDPLYLFYKIKTLMGAIDSLSYGTVFNTITKKTFDSLNFILPPLPEQRRIASILGSLDDKIELNTRMNKTLEEMAAAIFKCWFVDFEFPNKDGEPYKSSGGETDYNKELEKEVPKGWETKPLDQIADFLNGIACQKYPAEEGEPSLPVIKIRELRDGFSNNTNRASLQVPAKYIIEDGDVLFSWSATLLAKLWSGGRGILNQHIFKVTSENYPKWFYYLWIKYHLEQFQLIASSKVTTMGHIKRHHLNETMVLVPEDATLESMTEIMAPLIEQQLENEIESRTLASIRDALLPKLMSGEIRVKI